MFYSLDNRGIQEVCQSTLHDFNLCMFSQPACSPAPAVPSQGSDARYVPGGADDRSGGGGGGSLEDELVFKIIVICLAMIHLMQRDGQTLLLFVAAIGTDGLYLTELFSFSFYIQ